MHPSLQVKFGLRTDEDVAIAEHAMSAARHAGFSETQINQLLSYYSTIAPALERGQLDPAGALHQLWDYAKLAGIGEHHCWSGTRQLSRSWMLTPASCRRWSGRLLPRFAKSAPRSSEFNAKSLTAIGGMKHYKIACTT
jgi:hypothetical protein